MAKTEEPLNQLASDPIVAQILADCAQVSRELTSPSEPIESITRRRFLKGANRRRRRCGRMVQS